MLDTLLKNARTGLEIEMMFIEQIDHEVILEDGYKEYKHDSRTGKLYQYLDHTDDCKEMSGRWTLSSL